MKKLNIVIAHNGSAFQSAGSTFLLRQKELLQNGIQFQHNIDPVSQYAGLYAAGYGLLCASSTDFAPASRTMAEKNLDKELASLAEGLAPEMDGIWLFFPLTNPAIMLLADKIQAHPLLRERDIQPILALSAQDSILYEWISQSWKISPPETLIASLLRPEDFANYHGAWNTVREVFGRARVVVHEGDGETFAAGLLKKLGAPEELARGLKSAHWPRSLTGMDIASALWSFPFTLGGKIRHDRNGLMASLRRIEEEEGMPIFNPLARSKRDSFIRHFETGNAALAKELGIERLFSEKPWDSPDPPKVLPDLTAEACRPFVATLDDSLQTNLLRYFRDLGKPALKPEQLALASALEDYRKKITTSSTWIFPRNEPLLSVLTMAYNHNKYILECMESVAAQKTDFPIEHIIVDDGSNDGTQEIIEDYALKHPHVRPIYLHRGQGPKVSTLFLACKSEYAALCDGDDYFTDPNKLQIQVDFLRENKDCSVCFHPVHVKFENGQRDDFIFPMLEQLPRKSKQRFYLADLIQGNFIQTNSVVYRWRFRDGLPEWFNPGICPGDWYWHLLHAETGKIAFIPRVMSVYRRHSSALYSSAFIDRDKHFKEHGMHEVETINILNQHFKGRYFRHLANLSDSFFTSFYKSQLEDPGCHALDDACEKYPEFGLHFLQTLRSVQKEQPSR